MILKNAQLAIITVEKIYDYSLNPNHEFGGDKSRVFKSALGFDRSNYRDLIDAIRRGIMDNDAQYMGERPHGHIWRVDMEMTGPTGTATVRTGWIFKRGHDVPRLTTAYVI